MQDFGHEGHTHSGEQETKIISTLDETKLNPE